jgi:hypothetical protein
MQSLVGSVKLNFKSVIYPTVSCVECYALVYADPELYEPIQDYGVKVTQITFICSIVA